jgi:hypothetical protein
MMKALRHDFVYYGISASSCDEYRKARRQIKEETGSSELTDEEVRSYRTQKGQAGADITDAPLQLLNRKLKRLVDELDEEGPKHMGKRRQLMDQQAAPLVFQALNDLPIAILNDFDFWRFAAVHSLYDVVDWRYPKDNGARWGANPTQSIRTITYAWFVRGQLCETFSADQLEIVNRVGDIDIWTSHVIAVLHGSSPTVMLEYFRKCVEWQTPNGGWNKWGRLAFRDLAKQLQALRSNYVFDVMDHESAALIVQRLARIAEVNATERLSDESPSEELEDIE